MTIRVLIAVLSRHILLIVLMALLGIAGGGVWLRVTPERYTASAAAYVRVDISSTSKDSAALIYNQATNLVLQKAKAYQPLFTSKVVAEGVSRELGLDVSPAALASNLKASIDRTSPIINVTATASSPSLAQRIADETVRQTSIQARAMEGEDSPVQVQLMSPSALASPEKSPSTEKYLLTGLLVGIGLGIALAYLREILDRKVRQTTDVTKVVGDRVLGVLPHSKHPELWGTNSTTTDSHLVEESLRKIRTNLRYSHVDSGLSTLLITSATQSDGKSTLSKHLSRVIGAAGSQVVLVEADLRRPVFRKLFGIPADHPGLTHLLLGAAPLEDVLWKTDYPGLSVIHAGDTPPNTSELLDSARMRHLLDALARNFVVILDAPPILPVTDAAVLSRLVRGTLVVVSSGKTTVDEVVAVRDSIESAGGSLIGVVVNNVKLRRTSASGYGYGYNYRTTYSAEKPKAKKHRRAK